jgi:hypothetical protein
MALNHITVEVLLYLAIINNIHNIISFVRFFSMQSGKRNNTEKTRYKYVIHLILIDASIKPQLLANISIFFCG